MTGVLWRVEAPKSNGVIGTVSFSLAAGGFRLTARSNSTQTQSQPQPEPRQMMVPQGAQLLASGRARRSHQPHLVRATTADAGRRGPLAVVFCGWQKSGRVTV